LGPLPDHKRAQAKHHGRALGFGALDRNEPHRLGAGSSPENDSLDRFFARLTLAFHEGLDVGWCHEPHASVQLGDLATPEMRATNSLHCNDAGRQFAEKV
jgi:hypothetical protein